MSRPLTLAAAVGMALGAAAVPLSNHAPAPAPVHIAHLTNEVVTTPAGTPVTIWAYNAVDGSESISAPSNAIQTNDGTFNALSWTNTCPFVSGEHTIVCWEYEVGKIFYRDVGTNTSTPWPIPPQPMLVTGMLTGRSPAIQWLTITNPAGNRFFKLYQTTESGYVSISDSSDLTNWTSSFALFQSSNCCLHMAATQIPPVHQP